MRDGLEERRQEGVLGLEAEQQDDVGAVEQGTAKLGFIGTAWMSSTPVAMLVHVDEVAADVAGHVGEVGDRGDDLDLRRPAPVQRRRAGSP